MLSPVPSFTSESSDTSDNPYPLSVSVPTLIFLSPLFWFCSSLLSFCPTLSYCHVIVNHVVPYPSCSRIMCWLNLMSVRSLLPLETCQNFLRQKGYRICWNNAIFCHNILRQEIEKDLLFSRHSLKQKIWEKNFLPNNFLSQDFLKNHTIVLPMLSSYIRRKYSFWDDFSIQEIFKKAEFSKTFWCNKWNRKLKIPHIFLM